MADLISSDSSTPSPLLVVGSVAFDNVITPKAEQERILGGAASYCSFAASYYANVRMVGVVGNDFGESDLDRLRARGIDLEGIKKDESEEMTGESNIILAGDKLRQMGPQSVIIKKGEHGAVLFHEDGKFALPAYPVTQLNDPTGAGDSFAGALIGRLASRNRTDFAAIKEAMLYATCTASLTVEAFGCDRLESAGKSEIEERVSTLQKLISVA